MKKAEHKRLNKIHASTKRNYDFKLKTFIALQELYKQLKADNKIPLDIYVTLINNVHKHRQRYERYKKERNRRRSK